MILIGVGSHFRSFGSNLNLTDSCDTILTLESLVYGDYEPDWVVSKSKKDRRRMSEVNLIGKRP